MSGKLPDDCFAFYLGLGAERSYEAVARHFGVTKRTVSRRAADEDWQGKIRQARSSADVNAAEAIATIQVRHVQRLGELRDAVAEILTPTRVKAIVAALVKAAVQKEDVQAARVLLERLFGKVRTEPLPAVALDLPDGLETASDVRNAANELLQSVADGSLSPEDGQRAAVLVEAARKSIETEELEVRIRELEEHMKSERKR